MAYAARTAALPRGYGFTPYLLDSVGSASVVTAPGGTVQVCNVPVASTPQGFYEVKVTAWYGGTLTAPGTNENMNMALRVGSSVISSLTVMGNSSTLMPATAYMLNLSGTDAVNVIACNAGTANVVYGASLICTPVHQGA